VFGKRREEEDLQKCRNSGKMRSWRELACYMLMWLVKGSSGRKGHTGTEIRYRDSSFIITRMGVINKWVSVMLVLGKGDMVFSSES